MCEGAAKKAGWSGILKAVLRRSGLGRLTDRVTDRFTDYFGGTEEKSARTRMRNEPSDTRADARLHGHAAASVAVTEGTAGTHAGDGQMAAAAEAPSTEVGSNVSMAMPIVLIGDEGDEDEDEVSLRDERNCCVGIRPNARHAGSTCTRGGANQAVDRMHRVASRRLSDTLRRTSCLEAGEATQSLMIGLGVTDDSDAPPARSAAG